jgi:hypothetical protein
MMYVKKAFYGKQKSLRCSGGMRFHLSCLKFSEAEFSFYTANGESTYKCETCVKKLRTMRSENTPVLSLRSASASEIGGKMAPLPGNLLLNSKATNRSVRSLGCSTKW